MPKLLIELCGWLPGIVFPVASIIQLLALQKSKTAEGVSVLTWFLFATSNICLYIYMQKYSEPQTFGFLITAVAQLAIVFVALSKRKKHKRA